MEFFKARIDHEFLCHSVSWTISKKKFFPPDIQFNKGQDGYSRGAYVWAGFSTFAKTTRYILQGT